MEIKTVSHYSKEYWKLVRLRDKILRAPLNLMFSEEELFLEHDQIHVGCFDKETILGGFALVPVTSNKLTMRQVCVDDSHQSKGIGNKLMTFAEEWAKEKGYKEINCHARETAVPFYVNLGYSAEGNSFEEVGIPHFKMTKKLNS